MNKRKTIRGSGGGDPPQQSQRMPVEAADSLRSKAFLRVMDLISEGEIEGLVGGAQGIYLEETPLENATGQRNFTGIEFDSRNGTQSQSYIDGFSAVENELSVNVEVRNGGNAVSNAITRTVTDPNVNRVRVSAYIPQLTLQDRNTGDVSGSSVTIALDLKSSGGSYTEVLSRTITGKSSGRYEVSLSVPMTGNPPWNIRMRRTTADSASQAEQNKTFWGSITEVIDAKLRYPNSAIVAMRLDSQQFSSVPTRYYDIKGIKIQVPSNYDASTRVYTGTWDGTFQTVYSNNPAWVFYDLCTMSRYGLGDFIPAAQVDKWALYEIGKYCDEMVSDGFGGTEPRFTCNLVISDVAEAYTVMQNMASVFRGMIYWNAGTITTSQDSPQDAALLYTPANVVDGKFSYQGASAKARHSVALVSWNDPADFYRQKVEYVEDQAAIATYGVQTIDLAAFGCTSRGQAHRLGKWLLYTEQNESEVVHFRAGLDAIVGRPGQIIKIADPGRAGVRMGGRISSATTTTVTIDQTISTPIIGQTLSVMLPNGTIEDRVVSFYAGNVITVNVAFSAAPTSQGIWVLKSDTVEPQTFRVIGISEDEKSLFTITALRHNPDKFDFVENNIQLEPKSYSALREIPASPENLGATESLYESAAEVKAKVSLSWNRVDNVVSYFVRYKVDNNNFIDLPETPFNEQEILDTGAGTYTFQVSSINPLGKRSIATELVVELFGKTAPPVDVTGFSMIPNAGQAFLSWNRATDLDVLVGGKVRIRHTPNITGQDWQNAIDIIPAVAGTATSAIAPLLTGTYLAKFVDSSDVYSNSAVEVITTIPVALALNVVQNITEDPTFLGTKTNMTVDSITGAIVLSDTTLVDTMGLIDGLGSFDFPGSISSSGTYDFQNTVDLGGVWATNIYATIDLQAFDAGSIIDTQLQFIDDWTSFDGDVVNDVNAELYVRTTEDNPSGSPTWSAWKLVNAASYSARGFQFQLRCTSGNAKHNLYIKQLRVQLDLDDRAVSMGPLTSGTGSSYRVDYAEAFYASPAISITANNMGSGDFFTISSATETGFNIVFKNSSSTIVSRIFSVIAKGYGRKVG